MARGGGLFGRIGRAIRNIVAPSPPIPPRREPPPPPERGPQEPERGLEPRATYKAIWRAERGQGSYRKNLAVFHGIVDPIEDDPSERVDLWETYVRNINRNRRGDAYRRQSMFNPFWQESGIDPSSFDWKRWRVAMGFTGKNRSNTNPV